MKVNDIYKIIDYEKERYFLICLVEQDQYLWVRDCGWGFVKEQWGSSSNPIEFIANQIRAVNIKTSSGIDEIKRIYKQNLPKDVRKFID